MWKRVGSTRSKRGNAMTSVDRSMPLYSRPSADTSWHVAGVIRAGGAKYGGSLNGSLNEVFSASSHIESPAYGATIFRCTTSKVVPPVCVTLGR